MDGQGSVDRRFRDGGWRVNQEPGRTVFEGRWVCSQGRMGTLEWWRVVALSGGVWRVGSRKCELCNCPRMNNGKQAK